MTGHQPRPTDIGPRCICGHPGHIGRCPCGCRTYVSAGSHADQSRSGAVPVVVALVLFAVLFAVLVAAVVTAVLLRALW